MDRRERRRRAREFKKMEGRIKKGPLPKHAEHQESPGRFRRVLQALGSLVLALVTLAGGYALFRPHVSVERDTTLSPVDPYRTQFAVKNENSVFDVYNVECVCWPRKMNSGNGFSILSLTPLQKVRRTIPRLEPGTSSTIDCPPVIGGIGTYAGEVTDAELEIDVSFKESYWPFVQNERYPFKAASDSQKGIHWLHITPDEEKPIFSK